MARKAICLSVEDFDEGILATNRQGPYGQEMGHFVPCFELPVTYYDAIDVKFIDAKHIREKSCRTGISRSPRAPVLAAFCHAGVVLDGFDYSQGQTS
ncbi:hypothetical protein GCM10011408_25960 [Dyella caseinilytica]|nr:hypothetical protein GCM10011408_25960 [Dyella caseinilytica]